MNEDLNLLGSNLFRKRLSLSADGEIDNTEISRVEANNLSMEQGNMAMVKDFPKTPPVHDSKLAIQM